MKKFLVTYRCLNEIWYFVDEIGFGLCITPNIKLATQYGSREEAFKIVEEYGAYGRSNRVEIKEVEE